MSLKTQIATDPTADVPPAESALTVFLLRQLQSGVAHDDILSALLNNYQAIAVVHPCCTASAAKAALQVGGQLLVAAIERPAHTPVH